MKNEHLTFEKIPVGGLFVTGPGDYMFVKIDESPSTDNVPGGRAFFLHDGRSNWTPDNRIVRLPTPRDFRQLAERYDWEQITRQNPKLCAQHQ